MKAPKFNPVGKAKISADAAPFRPAASGPVPVSDFTHHMNRALALANKEIEASKKASAASERSARVTPKDIENLGIGLIANTSLNQPKIRTPHIDTNVVQAGYGPKGDKIPSAPKVKGPEDTKEVRPDVGELTQSNKPAKTSYREPPKKPAKDTRGVPNIGGNSLLKHFRWSPEGMKKLPRQRTIADLIIPRTPSGVSAVGSKPSRPANVSAAGTKRANKPSTQSSSAGIAAKGAIGRAGSEKRDIKDRNIDTPAEKKNDSISREMTSFLMEYIIKAPKNGVARWSPKQGSFTPLRDLEPPEMPVHDSDSNDPRMAAVPLAAKNLGIDLARGERIKPSTRPKDRASASKLLFGEDTMNPDKIANKIIREAFTSGDRNNTTPANNDMYVKGGLQRQMLAGEMVGSTIWPFDQTTNPMFDKLADLEMDQAHNGLFGKTGGSAMEGVAKEIVDNLLEDSPSSIYSDKESIGYLINELQESGYADQAAVITSICENAKEEDVVKVVEMIEDFEAKKADPFLISQLAKFAGLLIEEDDSAKSDDEVPSEAAAEDADTGKDTGGSGL